MTPDRIKELRKLCSEATLGPWVCRDGVVFGDVPINGAVCAMLQEREEANSVELADAAFISAARTALPEALKEIERLREYLLGRETVLARKQTAEIERLRAALKVISARRAQGHR